MKTVKLCDICDVRDGTHDSPSYYLDGYPFITTKNLVNGTIDFSTASLICEEDFRHFDKRSHVDDGDILMPMIGTIGGAIIVNKDREFAIKNVALIKKDKESIDFNFLLHVLNSNKMLTYFEQFKTGGTQKFISLNFIRNLPIPEKSLPEQQKIAAHLDSIQSAIDNKKQQLQQLDELVKSKFVEMFGENPIESGKWKVEKLKELTSKIGSGSTPKGGKGSYVEEGVSLIRSMNVHNGYFDYEDLAHLTDAQAKSLDGVTIEEGDVLINITGASVARCCIVPSDVLPARVNQHVSILRIKRDLMSLFLNYFLISDEEQFALLDIGGGGGATREAITKTELENLVVPVPPIELQNTFAEYVQKIDTAKSIIKTQLNDLNELLESKMDFYFGE